MAPSTIADMSSAGDIEIMRIYQRHENDKNKSSIEGLDSSVGLLGRPGTADKCI